MSKPIPVNTYFSYATPFPKSTKIIRHEIQYSPFPASVGNFYGCLYHNWSDVRTLEEYHQITVSLNMYAKSLKISRKFALRH